VHISTMAADLAKFSLSVLTAIFQVDLG